MLINDELVIDAGSIGLAPLELQRQVRHVFLSHSHMDHVATLPVFLENVYEPVEQCASIHASEAVLEGLRTHLFNDVLWPNFFELGMPTAPFCDSQTLVAEQPVVLGELTVTPVEVQHGLPTFGFLVEDAQSCVAIASDTRGATRLWQIAEKKENLKGIFLDSSFPNEMSWLAEVSHHMTPHDLVQESALLPPGVPLFPVHIKARYRDRVIRELQSITDRPVHPVIPGEELVL